MCRRYGASGSKAGCRVTRVLFSGGTLPEYVAMAVYQTLRRKARPEISLKLPLFSRHPLSPIENGTTLNVLRMELKVSPGIDIHAHRLACFD
jgi:hypothetical protein